VIANITCEINSVRIAGLTICGPRSSTLPVVRHPPFSSKTQPTGPALIHRAKCFGRLNVIPVSPDGRSKVERLQRHIHVIRDRRIILPLGAEWVEGYLDEMSEFPIGPL